MACKYCNINKGCTGEALPTAYHHGMWIECFNEDNDYILSIGNVGALRIKYCPMCGRKLKEKKMKEKYLIRYGTFNLDDNFDFIEFESLGEANNYAYDSACEDYDSMAGMHGVPDTDEIAEEYELTEETDIMQAYLDERESWISYDAKIATEEDYINYGT